MQLDDSDSSTEASCSASSSSSEDESDTMSPDNPAGDSQSKLQHQRVSAAQNQPRSAANGASSSATKGLGVEFRHSRTAAFKPLLSSTEVQRSDTLLQVKGTEDESVWELQSPEVRPPNVAAAPAATGSGTLPVRTRQQGPWTPLQVVKLMWPQSLMDWIVQHMNLVQKHVPERYKLVAVQCEDLERLLAASVIMQLVKRPRQSDYWTNQDWDGETAIPRLLSGRRYDALQRCLHFYDKDERPGSAGTAEYVSAPVSELIAKVVENYQSHFRLAGVVSMDEATIKFKGRHIAKQFNGDKPIKRGFKVFVLSDPKGYVWNAMLYLGKTTWCFANGEQVKKERGAGLYLAEQLLRPVSMMGTNPDTSAAAAAVISRARSMSRGGITVVCDRWFTGVRMAFELKQQHNISIVGTLHSNRLPLGIKRLYSAGFLKGTLPGDVVAWQRVFPDDSNASSSPPMTLVSWHDTKPFHTISTDKRFSAKKYLSGGSIRRDSTGNKLTRTSHAINVFYNEHMGGVDTSGQLQRHLTLDRKGKRWYMRIFWWLFEVSLCNAFLVHRQYLQQEQQACLTQTQFREVLVSEWTASLLDEPEAASDAEAGAAAPIAPSPILKRTRKRRGFRLRTISTDASSPHTPVKCKSGVRGRCEFCPATSATNKTPFKCKQCKAFVHIDGNGDCWERHVRHSMR